MAMALRLFDWGPSPFCLKVRAVLDYKGLSYERINIRGAGLWELRRRSAVGKVPALDIDGRLICDSTAIVHEIERLVPEPAVMPADARQAALNHVLEDWADEALYFIGLYYQWQHPEGAPMVGRAFGGSLLGRAMHVVYRRRVLAQIRGQGTGRKTQTAIDEDLRRELQAVTGLLRDQPYLLGTAPLLADFAVAAQLLYLSRPPASAAILAEQPALAAYLERMRALRRT